MWKDVGMVKRIRGVTFSTRVSVQFENAMRHAARGIFNRLLPDVHIFTDHKAGALSGKYVLFLSCRVVTYIMLLGTYIQFFDIIFCTRINK